MREVLELLLAAEREQLLHRAEHADRDPDAVAI